MCSSDLPKRTQEELNTLVELIKRYEPSCDMIILYGSYARGGYVLWDERVEFGVNTSYQSDYDIMVVVSKTNIKMLEYKLSNKLTPKYHKAFEHRRHASPQIIVESATNLNKALECSQYFFTDIVKEGIKLYDNKNTKLSKPRELSFKEIKQYAVEEFEIHFPLGEQYLAHGHDDYNKEWFKIGSFELHQACERFYNTLSLVFTNYRPKSHKLKELRSRTKEFSRELAVVFPENTEFEKRCFDLLCRAYIEARYNKDFVVTKEEYEYMLERIELMKEITNRICTEKIASYDKLIEDENRK